LLGAAVLYAFATSSVRGFAFFLGLSTVMDLLIAYFFMHPLVSIMARNPKLVQLPGVGIASALDVQGAVA
jgi:preprotein translocase subunit SecD